MTTRSIAAALAAFLGLGLGCDRGRAPEAGGGGEPVDALLEVYEYDPEAPLPFRFADAGREENAVRFSFRTWERETVDGLFALPAPERGSAPHPTVVYFHRLAEDESAALALRDALAPLGVGVLSVRSPVKRLAAAGGEGAREKRRESFRNRRMAVLEARSALDAIVARGLADAGRVAAVGASAGGGPAVVFGAVEARCRAVAALSTGADDFARAIPDRAAKIDEEARRTVASVDPLVFAPLVSPRPLLVVRGEADEQVTLASARALLDAAREPKRFLSIPGEPHRLPLAAVAPALVEFLGPPLGPAR